jgi:rSAM/selenodomain-associated transferase 1
MAEPMTLTRHLVVFAREPRLGAVKRRLARDVGALAAWRFQRLTTKALLRRLGPGGRWTCWLAVTPDRAAGRAAYPWPPPWRTIPQGPGDLGQRMGRVLRSLPPGPAAIVGSDIPDIAAADVAAAFARLGCHDWVIGPASDGGYWLIGARRRPRLRLPFAGVRWGGPHALADTLAGLGGQRVARLRCLSDVDEGADLLARRPSRLWR